MCTGGENSYSEQKCDLQGPLPSSSGGLSQATRVRLTSHAWGQIPMRSCYMLLPSLILLQPTCPPHAKCKSEQTYGVQGPPAEVSHKQQGCVPQATLGPDSNSDLLTFETFSDYLAVFLRSKKSANPQRDLDSKDLRPSSSGGLSQAARACLTSHTGARFYF